MFDIQIIGIKFVKPNQYGDFKWMRTQDEYKSSLYIFNDNEECHETCRTGLGNAVMRRFNNYSELKVPQSAGIPTGTLEHGGYQEFSPRIKKQIDLSIDEIINLISTYHYKRMFYSSELDGRLGTGIFDVNTNVLIYITHRLFGLTKNPVQIVKLLPNDHFSNINFDSDIYNEIKLGEENLGTEDLDTEESEDAN